MLSCMTLINIIILPELLLEASSVDHSKRQRRAGSRACARFIRSAVDVTNEEIYWSLYFKIEHARISSVELSVLHLETLHI